MWFTVQVANGWSADPHTGKVELKAVQGSARFLCIAVNSKACRFL